jgi:two-component system response regulator AtoC
MDGSMPTALLVDDERASLDALAEWVRREEFTVRTAETLAQAKAALERGHPDLLLVDLQLPDGSGLELLAEVGDDETTEIVVVTGHATIDSAVDAMRGGAIDYLTKPLDLRRLKRILANVRATLELRQQVGSLREELRSLGRFGHIVGLSPAMQHVYDLIEKVAPTQASVVVLGETGTGKELVAQTIHQLSRRSKEAFVPINCGAVPPQLIESELFGHERGSFTGAERTHRGIFERAHRGTLFLDEVTEMPPDLQVKLLRALETGRIVRVGGDAPFPTDVRVIAASNRNPERAVADGRLRSDLLYRLMVFPIELPPLHERGNDVELLAEHFLDRLNRGAAVAKTLNPRALAALRQHSWPGNVRELKNVVERAFIMAADEIDLPCLPFRQPVALRSEGDTLRIPVGSSIAEAEKRLILATLDQCAGDKEKAAAILGVSLKTLYNRLHGYGEDGAYVRRAGRATRMGEA